MNTPNQSRRTFLGTLATIATATAIAPITGLSADTPVVAPPVPGRIPLRWKDYTEPGGAWVSSTAYVGSVRIADYYSTGENWTVSHFGWNPGQRQPSISAARAAIQKEWDKICGVTEPVPVAAPRVKMLEWEEGQTAPWSHAGADGIRCGPGKRCWFTRYPVFSQIVEGEDCYWTGVADAYLPPSPTLEAAKAAAQAHWEKTVLSALV